VYDFWIDITNDIVEFGDIFTVNAKAEEESNRHLLFDQFYADRNPEGSTELGLPTPDLIYLFLSADGAQGTNSVLWDDFFLSSNGFQQTVPIAASSFIVTTPAGPITVQPGIFNSAAGSFSLSWSAAPGVSYKVLKSETLLGSWSEVGTVTAQAGEENATFTDATASSATAFYRIQAQ
ncbi:MAG: hypothetical protein ACTHMT_08640, partial [Verrucomicrobiota bacterium]